MPEIPVDIYSILCTVAADDKFIHLFISIRRRHKDVDFLPVSGDVDSCDTAWSFDHIHLNCRVNIGRCGCQRVSAFGKRRNIDNIVSYLDNAAAERDCGKSCVHRVRIGFAVTDNDLCARFCKVEDTVCCAFGTKGKGTAVFN